ncbi:MAG: hypothetical protein ABJE66_17340 [Deltaproteobacteria bacterium]
MKTAILIALLASGCLQDETDTGPTVTLTLATDAGHSVSSDESDPQFDLQGTSALVVTLELDTYAGANDLDTTSYPVTRFTGSLSLPATSFTEADFTSDGNDGGPTFTGNEPVTLPASAAGKTIAVTLTAQDSRGLSANPISFSVRVIDSVL